MNTIFASETGRRKKPLRNKAYFPIKESWQNPHINKASSTQANEFYTRAIQLLETKKTLINNEGHSSKGYEWNYMQPVSIASQNNPYIGLEDLATYWHKLPTCIFDKQVHSKVFNKVIKLITTIDKDAEPLSSACAYQSIYVCSILAEVQLLPIRMSRSIEGSIVFEFKKKGTFSSLEIFNDEEIVFLQDIEGSISAKNIDFNQIQATLLSLT